MKFLSLSAFGVVNLGDMAERSVGRGSTGGIDRTAVSTGVGARAGPGVSKLKLADILAVIRELRAILPAQQEHEGLPPIQVNVVAGVQVVPYTPDEQ